MDTSFTYVRVRGFVGRIRGKFIPKYEFQEFNVYNPITGEMARYTAPNITVITEEEAKKYFENQQEELREKHLLFLKRKGIEIEPNTKYSRIKELVDENRRKSACYECKSLVDSKQHIECSICNWIVCPSCGACGCGHPRYGNNSTSSSAKAPSSKEESTRVCNSFSEAKELAQSNPGSTLTRNPNGNGWLVRLK